MKGGRGDVVGRVLFIVTLVAVYPRIYFGFSFFDEAYYLALPVGFLAGHMPFVEERALPQLASLLTAPWVALWVGAVGSTEGIVLFARHLYFAAAVATALGVAWFWRRGVGERFAWLSAALVVVYVPFCLFALSYNTFTLLGSWLACVALAVTVSRVDLPSPAVAMGGATLALAIVSFGYPPMFFVALPALVLTLWQTRVERGTEAAAAALRGAVWAGGVCLLVLGGALLVLGLPGAFDEILAFSRAQAVQGGGALKLRGMFLELVFQRSFLALLASALLVSLAPLGLRSLRRTPLAFVGACLVAPALTGAAGFYREFHSPYTATPFVLSLLGFAAPLVFASARGRFDPSWRRGLAVYIALSWVAGLAIWWATSNGLRNAALGFAPAAIATLACIALPPREHGDEAAPPSPTLPHAVTLAMASLVAFGVIDLWTHAYRERPPARLEAVVEHGPWRGLRTTPEAREFVDGLARDLARLRETTPARSVYFYDYFPAGYLMSDLRPRASTLWTFPLGRVMQGTTPLREAYVEGLREQAALPDLVVRLACIPSTPNVALRYRPSDPLPAFFAAAGYESVLERRCYRIESR